VRRLPFRRPSPAGVIAAVALFVALGSGAYAATHLPHNSVGSKTIKNGAVKSPDIHNQTIKGHDIGDNQVKSGKIKNGAVTSAKASFITSSAVSGSNATTSNTPVDLGGPSVTVNVPAGGVVEVFAQAQIAQNGGGQNAVGQVYLAEPHLLSTPSQILAHAGPNLVTTFTSPGTNDANGVINPGRASWITLVPPAAGTYTFSLQYAAPGGGTATFQNRALLVRVTR
jgi:D-alanyl-D-alanine carboxypeptidase